VDVVYERWLAAPEELDGAPYVWLDSCVAKTRENGATQLAPVLDLLPEVRVLLLLRTSL
jgi:hypothetical protein